jgi:predicted TPR repeat methyltransferase
VFAEVRRALRPNGLLVFSCEDLERSPMRVDGTEVVSNTDSEGSDYVIVGNESNDRDNEIAGAVPGWGCQLLRSARFAHSHRYIEALCERHGFRVLAHQETILRTEETIPLSGNLYILQKVEKEVEEGVK